jgi:hypothetical protein
MYKWLMKSVKEKCIYYMAGKGGWPECTYSDLGGPRGRKPAWVRGGAGGALPLNWTLEFRYFKRYDHKNIRMP